MTARRIPVTAPDRGDRGLDRLDRRTSYSHPRRAASAPAWKRVSAPSSIISSAMRRRTVRRLRPMVRAICSSLAPALSWRRRNVALAGAAARQLGDRDGLLPVQLEEQGERVDERALADQQPRLVGVAERLGDDRVRAADHEQPGREVVDQPHLLPLVDPHVQRLRRLVQGADRVDRARTTARSRQRGRRPARSPTRAASARRRAAGRAGRPALLDQRGEQRQRVASGAHLAVERARRPRTSPGAGREPAATSRGTARGRSSSRRGPGSWSRPRGRSPPRGPGRCAGRVTRSSVDDHDAEGDQSGERRLVPGRGRRRARARSRATEDPASGRTC